MNPFSMLTAMSLRYDVGNQVMRINGIIPEDQDRWAWVFRLESIALSRLQGEAGVSFRLLDREWTIDSDLTIGGSWQWGPIPEKGTSLEWRIHTQKDEGKWRPWAHIALQPTLLINRYEISAADADFVEYDYGQSTSLEIGAGLTRWSKQNWNWGIGFDYFRTPNSRAGWPGIHVTVGKGARLR